MTRETLLQTLAAWIGEITEQAPPELGFDTDLVKDLALDSLALAELGSRLWLRHSVHLSMSELTDATRAGAIIDLVLRKLAAPPA